MAASSLHTSIPTTFYSPSSSSPSSRLPQSLFVSLSSFPRKSRERKSATKQVGVCKAMVQEATAVQGASATYAKEMERLSAKESLLLAFKDAGGFEALITGKITDEQRIDVMERITVLERLNPTPRPTTSPYLEGRWNLEWFGSNSTAFSAAQSLLERFPTTLASLSNMDLYLKDSYTKITANFRLLNSVESKLIFTSKLSVEGPLRMKEEYSEGLIESPTVIEEAVPEQLKSALGQAASAVQQLPVPVRDAMSSGIRIPLSFQRLFMISYLDDEIFIIRDAFGVPEVLTRSEVAALPVAEPVVEYDS